MKAHTTQISKTLTGCASITRTTAWVELTVLGRSPPSCRPSVRCCSTTSSRMCSRLGTLEASRRTPALLHRQPRDVDVGAPPQNRRPGPCDAPAAADPAAASCTVRCVRRRRRCAPEAAGGRTVGVHAGRPGVPREESASDAGRISSRTRSKQQRWMRVDWRQRLSSLLPPWGADVLGGHWAVRLLTCLTY